MSRPARAILEPSPATLALLPRGGFRDDQNLPRNPVCYSCKIRFIVGAPSREAPAELYVSEKLPSLLAAFAREFDEMADESDETYTAVDFIDWLTPSLRSGRNGE